RLAGYVRNVQQTLFRDLDPDEVLRLHYGFLNYKEKPLNELSAGGLSADYVFRETKRARDGVAGKAAVYPGSDIDIPNGKGQKQTTPDDVREAVKAAFRAGAEGVLLSRKYSEMRLANLSGAGQGLREAGVVKGERAVRACGGRDLHG